jgi:hypothetical protein
VLFFFIPFKNDSERSLDFFFGLSALLSTKLVERVALLPFVELAFGSSTALTDKADWSTFDSFGFVSFAGYFKVKDLFAKTTFKQCRR